MAKNNFTSTEGFTDLGAKFGKMTLAMQFEAKRITRNTTFTIQRKARELARDQDVYDTGYLIRNIKARFYNDGLTGEVVGGAEYHVFHELGTRFIPARPMLYPAALEQKPKYIAKLEQALQRSVRE